MTEDDEIPAGARGKLIERKQDWAREGRLLTGTSADPAIQRLPPGQRLVKDWPVLDLGIQPEVTPQKFRLDVDGAVLNPLSLSWDEFLATFRQALEPLRSRKGERFRILTGTITSPSLGAQMMAVLDALPQAKWHQYEAAGRHSVAPRV